MSDCPINGRAINTLYPINGCAGSVFIPVPPPERVGCYYLIAPECREYVMSSECRKYTAGSECLDYTISSCGCTSSNTS